MGVKVSTPTTREEVEALEALLAALARGAFPDFLPGIEMMTWGEPSEGADGPAEERASAMEARFRTLVEQIPAVTFMAVLGTGKNELYVSPQIEALLGFSQAEWLENPLLWYSQLHPEDRAVWNAEFARGCQAGGRFRAECRFLTRGGVPVWIRGEARLYKDAQGRPKFIQGVAFDVTESRRAQQVLVADAAVLEERVAERTKALLEANRELAREIADRKRVEEALQASEQQLRQSQKMEALGRLAGGIAHDFNNLLSVVLSYGDALQHGLPPGHPVRSGLLEIERAGQRAAALTSQLLAFGRVQLLAPAIVDLNGVASGMANMLARLIGEDIDIQFRLSPNLRKVSVDPRQVEQVLMNLAVNARDAMPDGGTLVVETANVDLAEAHASAHEGVVPGPHVLLTVTDTGVGMDAATRARVFEPFFTTKDVGKGSGLGLSTVFGIVQQSGGTITVDSEPGEGARFQVLFPSVEAGASEQPGALLGPPANGTETILLVEDDAQVRALATMLLRARGYGVLAAANGGDALLMSERFSGEIHLLLTDVVMPRMSGRELADRLAASRPSTKVLFMSGYTDDAVIRLGVGRADIAFLPKPLKVQTLAAKVRETLDRPTAGTGPASSAAGSLYPS